MTRPLEKMPTEKGRYSRHRFTSSKDETPLRKEIYTSGEYACACTRLHVHVRYLEDVSRMCLIRRTSLCRRYSVVAIPHARIESQSYPVRACVTAYEFPFLALLLSLPNSLPPGARSILLLHFIQLFRFSWLRFKVNLNSLSLLMASLLPL